MRCHVVSRLVSEGFRRLGRNVGRRPLLFVLMPLFASLILAPGLLLFRLEEDPELLYVPASGRCLGERAEVEAIFPQDWRSFDPGRATRLGAFGQLLVVKKDGRSLLSATTFAALTRLDLAVKTLVVPDTNLTFRDLCATISHAGNCAESDILRRLGPRMGPYEEGLTRIRYPLDTDTGGFYGGTLGGVTLDDEGFMQEAKAILLMYHIRPQPSGLSRAWEEAFLNMKVGEAELEVARYTSHSQEEEMRVNSLSLFPHFSYIVILMVVFAVGTSVTGDWVRSKPWMGAAGCLTSSLGTASAFGLCLYLGQRMSTTCLGVPFLILGIAMDDTFVLLGAWRRTDRSLSVEERMAETYAHSGISVTLTSLTNCIAFFICTQTPFRALNYFSVFAAASLASSFVFQTTMFGGLLAYSGKAEEQGLHAVTCKPAVPRSKAEDRGFWYQRCCTGGRDPDDPDNPFDNQDHPLMVWFRDRVGSFLIRKSVKIIVLILFFLYLSFAIWGALRLKEGLEVEDLFRHDSYAFRFAKLYQQYFSQYMVRIQVVIRESIDYFDPKIQSRILTLTSDLEKSPFISTFTHSWMKAFLTFANQIWFTVFRYDLHKKSDFFHLLRSYFLKFPLTSDFIKDIIFNENQTEIVASRFFLLSSMVQDSTESKKLLLYLRDVVDKSSLPVTVFNPSFMAFEQMVVIKECTIQSVATSAFVMMVVTFFFFPDVMCSLLVAFCMISVEVGVLGYMVWWGVTLNTASMIGLIMCVGFAVDNTAHMTYAYMTSKHKDEPNKKVLDALYSMGMPILQATGSTFIGLFAFCLVPSHQYITLFKTFFLVIVFSGIHSAVILPVLLSIFDQLFLSVKKRPNAPEDEAMAFTIQEFSHLKNITNGSIPHSNGNGVACHNRRFDEAIS